MTLTPEIVEHKQFQPTKFREGYDQNEVDDFLDEIVTELRRLIKDNEDLRQKLSTCEQRVGELTRAGARDGTGKAPSTPSDAEEPAATGAHPAVAVKPPRAAAETSGTPPEASAGGATPVAQPVAAGPRDSGGPEAVTGMLAMAEKLHDEYVRSGEEQRDKILNEAKEHATRLVGEAEERRRDTLGSLERERSLLERKIDELKAYEREYRSRLKAYLEGQLRELATRSSVGPDAEQGDSARGARAGGGEGGP
jgi:DivIVA domain-containing protein